MSKNITERVEALRREAIEKRYETMTLAASEVLALADEILKLRRERADGALVPNELGKVDVVVDGEKVGAQG